MITIVMQWPLVRLKNENSNMSMQYCQSDTNNLLLDLTDCEFTARTVVERKHTSRNVSAVWIVSQFTIRLRS